MDTRSPLLCPDCSDPFPNEYFKCESCGSELPQPHGIPSFGPQAASAATDSELIERIANLTREEPILEATNELLEDNSVGADLLKKVYNTRNDGWRILVSELIGDCCLDLYTGFGRRSLALAEIADTVYAVDPDLNKLRVLQNRDDFESRSSVFPVHADERDLRLQDNAFDTVVANYTGRGHRSLKTRVESLDSIIKESGSILLFLDGWTRQCGASKFIGLDKSLPSFSERFSPLAVTRVRRSLNRLGYDNVSTHTLLPGPEQLRLIYEVGNSYGSQQFVETVLSADIETPLIGNLVHWSHRLGLLDHLYPVYLIVGSKENERSDPLFSAPVVSTGRSRSVLFEFENKKLTSVWKYPNRRRHEAFNEREQEIIEWLQSEEPHIGQTLPNGELVDTRFGLTRKEHPVTGQLLSKTLNRSTESTRDVWKIGLEWLLRLQRPEEREIITLSPGEFVDRFSVPAADIEPPQPSGPVEFFKTPVHGDFKPGNVYVDGENVSSVIDWEYGVKTANPVIDAGFFILHTFESEDQSIPDLIARLLTGCSSVDPVRESIQWYSERVNISLRSILFLLPTVYIHRIKIDRNIGAGSIYTTKERQRVMKIRKAWGRYKTENE